MRLSQACLIVLYLAHYAAPSSPSDPSLLHRVTGPFIHVQYGLLDLYDIGPSDAFIVIHWVILLTFLRLFLMQRCFGPFASHICKIRSTKARVRFEEQSWSFVYYTVAFVYGLVLYCRLEYFLNLDNVYRGWPHDQMLYAFKCYYLMQMAFWIQQVFVLNVEEPRKDHIQMFSHHIITCLLLLGLYYYYFLRVGHCILMIMDSVDIILAAAKMLKYTGMIAACDAMFLLFLVLWVVMRHGVYNVITYHVWDKLGKIMIDSHCSLPLHPSKRCWTNAVPNTFFGLLVGLQIITLVWMYLICKVAYKVITGKGAEDVRSDDEDSDVDEKAIGKHTVIPASQPDCNPCIGDCTDSSDNTSVDEKTI